MQYLYFTTQFTSLRELAHPFPSYIVNSGANSAIKYFYLPRHFPSSSKAPNKNSKDGFNLI